MKRRLLAALAVGLCLCLTLTACSPKEVAQELVYKAVVFFGFVEESSDDEEEVEDLKAPAGGVVTFPEGMDTDSRLSTLAEGDTLYVSFKGIQNRNTPYFVAASDRVTITAYATTDSTKYLEFKTALWELSDDQSSTSYVQGSTVYYDIDGSCYTQTVAGLTPGKLYKVNISYDTTAYYVTGGLAIQGLSSEELTDLNDEG